MLTKKAGKSFLAIGIWSAAALACCLGGGGSGDQPKASGAAGQPKGGPKPLYSGLTTCAGCHSLKKPEDTKGLPPILCRCNEALTWEQFDKHKVAYTNVFKPGGRGEQMKKLLNYSQADVNKNCVVCHGVYIPEDKIDVLADTNFRRDQSEGVTCVACHGAYEDWVDRHGSAVPRIREAWRKLSRQEKETQYGMTDLWDAGKRSLKCASCHIGNTEEGKIITHTMYAVGHPPLPGLEVSTFSEAMPRHWQYLREKSGDAKKLLNVDPTELEITKLVIVGGLVDLQAAMNLLASQAELRAKEKEPEQRVLDLAYFDCYACHHDLKSPGWRQERGYRGPPGRPQFRPWPLALINIATREGGQSDLAAELDGQSGQLHKAFDLRPFGRLEEVGAAARGMGTWAAQLKDKLNARRYDKSAALSILCQLAIQSRSETPDYDSARQFAWAFGMIYREWDPQSKENADFQKKWKALDDVLGLRLPATQQEQILKELPNTLQKINDYDPGRFRKTFAALCDLLPKVE